MWQRLMTHGEDGGHRFMDSLERLTPVEEERRWRKRLRLLIILVVLVVVVGWLIMRA